MISLPILNAGAVLSYPNSEILRRLYSRLYQFLPEHRSDV